MDGNSHLVCRGFVEGGVRDPEGFAKSKAALQLLYGLTDRQIGDRLETLLWGLTRGGDPALVQRIPTRRNLWVAALPGGFPPLRVYLQPRADVEGECELLWIEERPPDGT